MVLHTVPLPVGTAYTVAIKPTNSEGKPTHTLPLDEGDEHIVVVMTLHEYAVRMRVYTAVLLELLPKLIKARNQSSIASQIDTLVALGLELHEMFVALKALDDEQNEMLREEALSALRFLHTAMCTWRDAVKSRRTPFYPRYFAFVKEHPLVMW